ncbi:hypothetical protein EDC30_11916 [Paucimonas lemoignei]|uniref:DUF4157 domain-containing protein n=1 Tax=Paucimonas lemoignei TaxID=29443 RepID=A0A4R3HP16_PAULE|nr:hypothetical protein [Paucimonas lemoignei]TCS32905.1 hypothetical protein EDC30_11916 [Paucimonas lemoignei]
MLDFLDFWIDETNKSHEPDRRSCSIFQEPFKGFYTPEFLKSSYFVVVDKLPKPDTPMLRDAGLGDFIDMDFNGVTYKDTYYVLPRAVQELSLHFHELVHVVQWRELTAKPFISRYIDEYTRLGYRNMPLEEMAYGLEERFSKDEMPFDVEEHVLQNL